MTSVALKKLQGMPNGTKGQYLHNVASTTHTIKHYLYLNPTFKK